MKMISLLGFFLLAACGGSGGDDTSSCTINGQTGVCDPQKATSGCLSESVICRCDATFGSTTPKYMRVDCVQFCKSQDSQYSSGTCYPSGGRHTCMCGR